MFYKEESLSKLLKCPNCNLKMVESKILPCGIFCNGCANELSKNNNQTAREFECSSCNEYHTIPDNGFKIWKQLDEFNSSQLTLEEIYRGESAEKLKKSLKIIQQEIDELNFKLQNGTDLIKEHCSKVRNKVLMETEIVIKQVRDLSDDLINEIFDYEANCISNFEKDNIIKENFKNFIQNLKSFHNQWNQYLNKSQILDLETDKANNLISALNKRINLEKEMFHRFAFNNKPIKLNKEKMKIDKNLLGNLELSDQRSSNQTNMENDIQNYKSIKFVTFNLILNFGLRCNRIVTLMLSIFDFFRKFSFFENFFKFFLSRTLLNFCVYGSIQLKYLENHSRLFKSEKRFEFRRKK